MSQKINFEKLAQIQANAKILFSSTEIDNAIAHIAEKINTKYKNSNLLCLVVMIGGFIPAAKLIEKISIPIEIDYIHATRYGGEITGKNELLWKVKPKQILYDRNILIIDDILDEGFTLQKIIDYCYEHQAKNVSTAVLLERNTKQSKKGLAKADFTALSTKNDNYVFGCGMDYKEYLRNLPNIYAMDMNDI